MITIPLSDFDAGWDQQYFTSIVRKYKDNVVAFKITDQHFHVLLKGKIKFFLAKLHMGKRRIRRVSDDKIGKLCSDKNVVVVDKDGFDVFNKKEILKSLQDIKQNEKTN